MLKINHLAAATLGALLWLSQSVLADLADIGPDIIKQYRQGPEHWPPMQLDKGVAAAELTSLPAISKPVWQTKDIEALGKQLFFDPRLSGSGQISCASCHEPQLAWGDGIRSAFGHDRQHGNRNTMSILNTAFYNSLFWDGRAASLEEQALGPIENPIEMNANLDEVIGRLNTIKGYRRQFRRLFNEEHITKSNLAKALAAFERTIVSKNSRFDLFVKGRYTLLKDKQIQGLHLFRTKARCINCHNGPAFSDNKFHNIGLSYYGRKFEDLGRYQFTGKEEDKGKFRTPSLRDVAYTGPWMHNGLFNNLRGLLNLYNVGITFNKKLKPGEPAISPLIKPINLSREELDALESFLQSISRRPRFVEPPELPDFPGSNANIEPKKLARLDN